MEKVVLVDGNNLLFRSYYATAYSGNFMKNSRGFPTNGLYAVSYTHLRAHETDSYLVCRLLLEKKKNTYPSQR